ncbi:MAG: DUF1385 domain-containing protein [Acetobacteraceae bacterium]|nr:DUF1385 domain-containing protein [Acetobacteraceae bacterium]
MERKESYGGQAVIEGVMMRGRDRMAVAVRRPDGSILVRREPIRLWTVRGLWPKVPFVRGFAALVESLVLGIDALMYSANQQLEEGEKMGGGATALAVGGALVLVVGLFMVVPTLVVGWLRHLTQSAVALNLAEGAVRLALLLGYVASVSLLKDIHRVLQYHGAEHKVIHAHEATGTLSLEEARRHSILHPRCGTNFLLLVAVVSVLVFSFFGWPNWFYRLLTRLAMLPVVAALAYEWIRLTGRAKSRVLQACALPGLWLQRFTAREPDPGQIEVALAALRGVLEEGPAHQAPVV